MYALRTFREERPEELDAIMRAASLPVLVSPGRIGLIVTHLPLSLVGTDRLVGHVARANPHWRDVTPGAASLAIFTAVDGYISPSWYPTKTKSGKVVPTWNYQAVHASGPLEVVENPDALRRIVSSLTDRFEANRDHPWSVNDAPEDYLAAQLQGIVGLVLHIEALEGISKLSQNKSLADRHSAAENVARENPQLAAAMQKTFDR